MNLWTDADWTRLTAYLTGELPSDEQAMLDRWIAQHPGRAEAIARLSAAWRLAGLPRGNAWDIESMLRDVEQQRTGVPSELHVSTHRSGNRPPRPRRGLMPGGASPSGAALPARGWSLRRGLSVVSVAAALCAMVIVGVRYVTTLAPTTPRVYRTGPDQRATIALADGSRVILAPQTVLRVSGTFGRTTRDVTLLGEALFDVVHDHGAVFAIHTGSVVTRVLGTTFDVKHYSNDPNVRVAVATGKVSAGAGRAPITLTSGTVAYVTDSTVNASTVDHIESYTGWTHGTLAFDETAVPALLHAVGQWYGVQFQLADSSIARSHVTVTIANKTQAEALSMLEDLLDVTMTFDRRADGTSVVTLHPRRGASAGPRRALPSISTPKREVGR